jgi:hypothetical protein
MTDTVLIVAWLVFAHLAADFILQNDWIAINKGAAGRTGWSALGMHGFHVGLCLLPFALAYGLPGVVFIAVAVVSHMVVDRWKVRATRRANLLALEAARARLAAGLLPASGLGSAWTAWPGLLFLADQVLHLSIALVAWFLLLDGVPLLPGWVDAVNVVLRDWDRATVHAVVLSGVVLVSLFIVNTRAAYYFVLAMISRRELPADPAGPAAAPAPAAAAAPASPTAVPTGASARIEAAIGALERLVISALVLVGAEVAIGFVLVAKTIARFRQLEDRGYAEYYLLGTFASVTVAVAGAIVARAALATLP